MKRILVATDFSTRSDRALRRATLLAKASGAELMLLHVVDDDQPRRLMEAERRESTEILSSSADTAREADGVACEAHLVLGDPFQAIVDAAERLDADLVILGPHRRQALRDIFVGTTVERAIRLSRRPVIMVNAVPAKPYDCVLVATDFSDCSAAIVKTARKLGFLDVGRSAVLHAFESPAEGLMRRASVDVEDIKHHLDVEKELVDKELTAFLEKVEFVPTHRTTTVIESTTAQAILEGARELKANLIIIGTHGRSGLQKLFLGNEAEEVLRDSELDVLVVPATLAAPAGP